MDKFNFPKISGSHADLLAAFGAADLLVDLDPIVSDSGTSFQVSLARDVTLSDLDGVGAGFKYLQAKESASETGEDEEPRKRKKSSKMPATIPAFR